ncbi:MAG: glucosaminidase domain-containing protein [Alphaproteobacteria bacterium]|nr:glucosaminidase domain-containing protein [Alphaproteobacteria bacterium]
MAVNSTVSKKTSSDFYRALRRSWIFTVIVGFGVGLAIIGLLQPQAPKPLVTGSVIEKQVEKPRKLATHTVAKLKKKFSQVGYSIESLEANGFLVPRVWPDAVPVDLQEIEPVQDRKALFVKMMLPIVLMANERILRDRAHLVAIHERTKNNEEIAQADKKWLENLAKSYRLKKVNIAELLRRVDEVPVSLAVAQAAIESGWGTSRFAKKGNALFGQWTWGDDNGIVPDGREEGKTHKIKAFDSPLDSVMAYVHNLNTNRAYRKLRQIRAAQRAQGLSVSGVDLTVGLEKYSEKGMEYVYLLQNIIRSNDMARFDKAKLGGTQLASLN